MFSEKLKEVVLSLAPAEIPWTDGDVSRFAEMAGLEIVTQEHTAWDRIYSSRAEFAVVSWGEEKSREIEKRGLFGKVTIETVAYRDFDYAAVSQGDQVIVAWMPKIAGSTLTFSPYLKGIGGASGIGAELLKAAQIESREFELSEKTVRLPLAPWNRSYSYDYGSGIVEDTMQYFVSEAQEPVETFIRKLADLAEMRVIIPQPAVEGLEDWGYLSEEIHPDYQCPNCGSSMSSGIKFPGGDYQDWLVMPHCTKCDFEPLSEKTPFNECVERRS